jgi:hypothetical protein
MEEKREDAKRFMTFTLGSSLCVELAVSFASDFALSFAAWLFRSPFFGCIGLHLFRAIAVCVWVRHSGVGAAAAPLCHERMIGAAAAFSSG